MREAINNNPLVQIGLLGVLGVIVAVVLMSSSGGDAAPAPEDATTATATAPALAAGSTCSAAGRATLAHPRPKTQPPGQPPGLRSRAVRQILAHA